MRQSRAAKSTEITMKKTMQIVSIALATAFLSIQSSECYPVSQTYLNLGYRQPNAQHMIHSISYDRDVVEFTDGSQWQFPSSDFYTILNWRPGDTLLITQNPYFFSFYDYTLQNLTTATYALANLTLWPIRNNPYSHWIDAINYTTGQLILEDGTMWEIPYSDYTTFQKWFVGDLIVVGSNHDQYFTSYNYILINTNSSLKEFVQAKMR